MTYFLTSALASVLLQEPDATLPTAHTSAMGDILHNTGPVAIGVLVLLAMLSVFSWTIMIAKYRSFGTAREQSARFLRAFRKSGRLSEIASVADQFKPSPLAAVFVEINDEYH